MMVLTAKVDFKKIMGILVCAAAVLLVLVLTLGKTKEPAAAAPAAAVSANDTRVKFLEDFGWKVNAAPKESSQVKIPDDTGEMFRRYNALQKGQGYDLSAYAGKKVMRYVYEVTNYPGAVEPVYATLLIYKDKIIGGDVTNTSPRGKVGGFKMPILTEKPPQETEAPLR